MPRCSSSSRGLSVMIDCPSYSLKATRVQRVDVAGQGRRDSAVAGPLGEADPGFAGLTHYLTNGRPKVVFYYRMKIIGHGGGIDTGEIQSVAWLTPEEAAATLTHAQDRLLITTVFALPRR